ncbi:MAG TPA: PDZ domain-containing protein [Candidatus Limnocylindria bacterium]
MDANRPYRPRVSRETRLLLTTALVAIAALWVLARIRFPDSPATPNPVAPLLSQLATTPTLEGLASEVTQLQARFEPSLVALDRSAVAAADGEAQTPPLRALRIRDDLAIALLPADHLRAMTAADRVAGHDPASGLVVVRVAGTAGPQPAAWAARRPDRARFLMVTEAPGEPSALRPVFVTSLQPVESPVWPDLIWMVPGPALLEAGSFVFSTAGELAGMVVEHGGRPAIVPTAILLAEVERLVERTSVPAGDVGIHAQPLTPDVAAATGASVGVVVTWVNPAGPAVGTVAVGDVIESMNGQPVPTPEHWRVRLARLEAGERLALGVRRGGQLREIELLAPAAAPPLPRRAALGLQLRPVSSAGAEVVSVEPDSAADRAGLAAGDVITSIGDLSSPTPLQVRDAFAAAPAGHPILVGVTRGVTHLVTTLSR